MQRFTRAMGVLLSFGLVAALPATSEGGRPKVQQLEPLSAASIKIEVNSTDQDAGFQIFLDGVGWKEVSVSDPRGREILESEIAGGVKSIGGGTELFLETNEPEYEDLDELQDLIDLLPEGLYRFVGKTAAGNKTLAGVDELTHVVPAGPVVLEPASPDPEACAEGVDPDDAVIRWELVTTTMFGSPDIEIIGYQVIVQNEAAGRSFQVDLPADADRVMVSPEFLEAGTEHKFEILAIEASGNQTITEACFVTD